LEETNKSGGEDATVIQESSSQEGAAASLRAPFVPHKLKVREGSNAGETFQLTNNGFFIANYILGRNPESCDIVIDDDVSNQHVEISIHSNSVYIRDLGSKNGTRLNGKKLSKKKGLRNGDLISIGSTVFQFFPASDRAPQTPVPSSRHPKPGNVNILGISRVTPKIINLTVIGVVCIFLLTMLFLGKEKSDPSQENNGKNLEISKADRTAAEKNLQIALIQFKKENYSEASSAFENAFSLDPALKKNHREQYIDALLNESQENYPKNLDVALASVIKAEKIDPENYKTQYQLGRIYAKLRQYDKAEKAYEKSIRLNDRFPDSYFDHAYILGQKELYQEAIKRYKEIIPLKPDYLDEVYINIAIGYLRTNDIKQALQYAEMALDEAPQNRRALEILKRYGGRDKQ